MLNNTNSSLLGGRILLHDILECFKGAMPDSIILGGSCADGENNLSSILGKEYYLSDIDLLCIREIPYSAHEANSIYKLMLKLSSSQQQSNPYFHIGLKLRGRDQLKEETESMYFRELSERSICLIGKEFQTYFEPHTVFGFFADAQPKLHSTLLSCAITRLWCNVLFYPAALLREKYQLENEIWYNYFYARGCLDWMTFRLIAENQWVSSYKKRYLTWMSIQSVPLYEKQIISSCIDTKLGNTNLDYRSIFSAGIDIAVDLCGQFCSSFSTEFNFVISMNRYIEARIEDNATLSRQSIDLAISYFNSLSGITVICKERSDDVWMDLRSLYSEFRFKRSPRDRMDHEVYTEFFLSRCIDIRS